MHVFNLLKCKKINEIRSNIRHIMNILLECKFSLVPAIIPAGIKIMIGNNQYIPTIFIGKLLKILRYIYKKFY
jgi:hypothetical protein